MEAKFVSDLLNMPFCCALADHKSLGNRAVRQALGD